MLTGVSASTDAGALFRGMVEGIALTYARVAAELGPAAPQAAPLPRLGDAPTEVVQQ